MRVERRIRGVGEKQHKGIYGNKRDIMISVHPELVEGSKSGNHIDFFAAVITVKGTSGSTGSSRVTLGQDHERLGIVS